MQLRLLCCLSRCGHPVTRVVGADADLGAIVGEVEAALLAESAPELRAVGGRAQRLLDAAKQARKEGLLTTTEWQRVKKGLRP